MSPETARWLLPLAVVLFVLYLVLKSRIAFVPRRRVSPEVRKRLADAKRRAVEPGATAEARSKAWSEAAGIALQDLARPNLAASFASRALKSHMEDDASVELLSQALRRTKRYRTLERWLWRRLAHGPGAGYAFAHRDLIDLYEGPMRRPVWAAALKRFKTS